MAKVPRYNMRDKVNDDVRRQIEALVQAVESMGNGNGTAPKSNGSGMLSDVQINAVTQKVISQLASTGLLGAFAQTPIGTSTSDPLLATINTGGTVTGITVGNLSPLFTTSVANPTTAPAVTFAQVNQNANLIFAGPSSGVAAAPMFRSLVAADLASIEASLLSTATLDLNTNTKQTLYTVPAGKSCLPLWVVGRSASTDLSAGTTLNLSFGFNAGANDWALNTFQTPAFTSSSLFLMMDQTWGLAGSPAVIGTAAQTFGAITDAAFGSVATLVIETFGYLI